MNRDPNTQDDQAAARTRLWDLIKDTRFAMFTTRQPDGHLHSRPMTTQNSTVDEDSSLWFTGKPPTGLGEHGEVRMR